MVFDLGKDDTADRSRHTTEEHSGAYGGPYRADLETHGYGRCEEACCRPSGVDEGERRFVLKSHEQCGTCGSQKQDVEEIELND